MKCFIKDSSLLRPSILIGVAYLLITWFQFAIHENDLTYFLHIGSRFEIVDGHVIDIGVGDIGYDGQLFYFIALDPLNTWRIFGPPASYRYQRILYPLLARGLAFGVDEWIPVAMLAINFVSVVFGTEVLTHILERYGKSRDYGILYGLYVGQLLAYSYAVVEPFMYMLALLGVYASVRNQLKIATSTFLLALFAKETAIFFIAGCVVWFLFRRKYRYVVLLSFGSILPFLVYQAMLNVWLGGFGFSTTSVIELLPFLGVYFWRDAPANLLKIIYVVIIPIFIGLCFLLVDRRRKETNPFMFYLVFNILFMMFLTHLTYYDISVFSRTAIGLNISLLLYGAARSNNRMIVLLTVWTIPFTLWFIQRMPKL